MAVISAYQLAKVYGDKTALSDFSIQIPAGEVFGLLGPANSGKTAFLRILAGLTPPSAGECAIMQYSPQQDRQRLRTIMGVVTETAKLYGEMTVTDNLRFFANLSGVDTDTAIDRISFLLHGMNIWEYRDTPVSAIPTNAVQRANIARALIHSPKVLLLDEPTMAMDRETTESVKYIIHYITKEEGVTSLLCTRHAEHAQKICTRFGIMKEGSMLVKGSFEELRISSGIPYEAELRIMMDSLLPIGFTHQNGKWRKAIEQETDMPQIIAEAVAHGCKILEAKVKRPTLEQIGEAFISGAYLERKGSDDDAEFDEISSGEHWLDEQPAEANAEEYSTQARSLADNGKQGE